MSDLLSFSCVRLSGMPKITGNCLCGEIGFELEDDFHLFNLCHCKQCQRATGSAHASNLFTAPGNIRWTKGEDHVRRYDVPDREISNAFCTNCGSGLPYISKSGKSLIVQAGLLNDPLSKTTTMRNIFWTERAEWYDKALVAEHHDTFPD
jgi:hypothetical protein